MNDALEVEAIQLTCPIVDAHGHTLDLAFKSQRRFHADLGGLTDVPLMRAGGVTTQLTPCWVPDASLGAPHGSQHPLRDVLRMIDYLLCELDSDAGEYARLATTADDIEAAWRDGTTAFVLGLEDGDLIQGDLAVLRTLYRLGVRHIGLVHEGRNAMGTATLVWDGPKMRLYDSERDSGGGLTDAGKRIIREMNHLGMLVDVTHMVEASFWDALEVARAPVIVTHGNARTLRDTARYLTDEQIRAVAETKGLICPSPTPLGPGNETASLKMLLDHIDFMVRLVGAEHVGFGTDLLDQSDARPDGLSDISETGEIIKGLRERGHDVEAINQIMGANFMRVFKAVAG
jgi:membrane dipeptidase